MQVTLTPAGQLIIANGGELITLGTDDALTLFGRLSGILPSMPAPELYRTDEGDKSTWACPHCGRRIIGVSDLIEYDSHQAESDADVDGDSVYVSQAETTRETMAFLCGHCRKVVTVPGEMSVNFS